MRKIFSISILTILTLNLFLAFNFVNAEVSGDVLDKTIEYAEINPEDDVVTECMGVFPDVENKFCPYIEYLYHQRVISGNTKGEYMPLVNLTRGALSKYVVNAFNLDINIEGIPFADVNKEHTFFKYIMTLKNAKLVSGYSDGKFKPDRFVTRAELTKFVVNVAEYKQPDLFANVCVCEKITLDDGETIFACPKCAKDIEVFPDVTFENKFYSYITKLYGATKHDNEFIRIIGGYSDGTFKPNNNITRAEVAKIIANTMKYGKFQNIKCARYFCQDKFKIETTLINLPEYIQIIKSFASGNNLTDIEQANSKIYLSDSGKNKIFSLDFNGKNLKTLAGDLDSPTSISYSQLNDLVFLQQSEDRAIGIINLDNSSVTTIPGITQEKLGNGFELDAYTVGINDHRVYAIAENNQVNQMNRINDYYGLPTLRMDKSELNKILDIEIFDGRIFLTFKDQGIKTFYGSAEQINSYNGIPAEINLANVSAISIKSRHIFLADNINKNIYELEINDQVKTQINFIRQINLENLSGEIKDLVTNDSNNEIYALVDNKVVKIIL